MAGKKVIKQATPVLDLGDQMVCSDAISCLVAITVQ